MTDISKREIKRVLQRWFVKAERARWIYGILGRSDADSSAKSDQQDHMWVRMDTGTLAQVYNAGGVDDRVGLPVRMRDDGGRLIIEGVNTSGLLVGDANAPSKVYSVNDVGPDGGGNVELDPDDFDDTATTNKFTTAAEITKLAGIEALADVTDAGNIASSITGVATDDTIVDADVWGYLTGGVLVKTAWSNIKAVLKTYFDTVYTFALIVADNSITNAKLRDSGALSVIGRSANSSGDPADISASAASDAVLRESGSALGFGTIATGGIAADAVTFAKMQNIATDSLLGRDTASTGDVENILLGASLSMDGSGNLQRAALTGDVTAAANGNATTIANDAVTTAKVINDAITFAKMQNIATDSLIGRDTAGTGDAENILLNATLSMDGSGNLQRAALSGDISASAGSNTTAIGANKVLTAMILDANVTLAKLANIATDSLIGRDTASSGVPENILLNATLSMDGSGNLQRAALTGDVAASAGSNTTAIGTNKVLTAMIADAQVTLAKMANLAADTIIGRANGAGTGVPTALSAAQVAAIINTALDHNVLTNLATGDVHTHYAILAGRASSQVLNGGTAANEDLTLRGTAHATKTTSYVILQDTGGFVAVGHATPTVPLHVASDAIFLATFETLGSTKNAVVSFVAPTGKNTNFAFWEGANLMKELRYDATANGFGIVAADEATFNLFVDDATGKVIVGLTSAGASVLGVKAGTSTNDAAVGGVLYVDSGTHGNTLTGEDDLATYTVPANTLSTNNMSLEFEMWGTCVNNANTKTLKLYFGVDVWTVMTSGAGAGAISWLVRGRIIRTGAATQDIVIELKHSGTVTFGPDIAISTATRTLSGTNVLKLTGEATATNDIVQQGMIVKWADANT